MMKEGEFFEGTKSLLVDKNNNPQWKYKKIEDIP
jgi:hypothetical protein